MSQNPAFVYPAKNPSNVAVPALVDAQGALVINSGGLNQALNITAAKVIKASAGRVCRIVVVAPGTTSGRLTINDCATTGAATTANQVFTALYSALTAGQVISLDFPAANGIVVSAVPGAGSPQFNISYN